jgi:hypothetical protein
MKIGKIMGRYILSGMFLAGVMIFNGCELAEDIIGNEAVEKLEGEWTCDEQPATGKKSTEDAYTVYISADPDNMNGVIIDNFYGVNAEAKATIIGMSLSISTQTIEGDFEVSGSGVISSGYKEINLSYSVDDGSGVEDHFTAVYTKL